MTKNSYIASLIEKGATDEDVINALMIGDVEAGIKPVAKEAFAKLQLRKYKLSVNK